MPEILQIFHQPPPSHHEMHPHFQRDLVNAESQFNWSMEPQFPSPGISDVTDHFQASDWAESPFTNFSSSSVDELSKVTAVIEQNQNVKKRKLEFDAIEVDSRKQSAEADSSSVKPPMANTDRRHGSSKPKPDFIHVRARRGQATDSHSLAERTRREKLKKKMQILQDLVPGCNQITNKALILDEIISYVQCLQSEVEFLSKKLAISTSSVVDFECKDFIV